MSVDKVDAEKYIPAHIRIDAIANRKNNVHICVRRQSTLTLKRLQVRGNGFENVRWMFHVSKSLSPSPVNIVFSFAPALVLG